MVITKIAFVLRLVDDFSGKVILRKRFQFRKDGNLLKPIQKEEGLYVFLEPMNDIEQIEIEGFDYHSCVVEVDKAKLDKKNPVLNVRLYGRRGGSFSYAHSLLEGRLEEGETVFPALVCVPRRTGTGLSLKEIRKADGKQHLIAYGFTKEILQGKTFGLSSGDSMEVFIITERIGMNEYAIEGNITREYPDKTPIQRVYCSVTNKDGNYAIPVPDGEAEQACGVIVIKQY